MISECIERDFDGCSGHEEYARRNLARARFSLADKNRSTAQIRTECVAEFLSVLKKQAQHVKVVTQIPLLRAIAAELFFGPIDVEFQTDPEIADAHAIVFNVQAAGDLKEIAGLRSAWYARTFELLGVNCDKVRLSIDIKQ